MSKNLGTMQASVEIDTQKMKKGSAEAKKEASKMAKSVNDELGKIKNPLNEIMKNDKNLTEWQRTTKLLGDMFSRPVNSAKSAAGIALQEIRRFTQEAKLQAGLIKPTDAYKEVQKDIEKADAKLERLYARSKKMQDLGSADTSRSWQSLQYDIEKTVDKLDQLYAKERQMEQSGKAWENESWNNLMKEISAAEKALERLQEREEKMKATGADQESRAWKSVQYDIQQAEEELTAYKAKRDELESGGGAFEKASTRKGGGIVSKAFSGMKAVLDKAQESIKRTSGLFGSLIQRFRNGIPWLNRTNQSMQGMGNAGRGLGGMLRTIGMSARFMFASFLISGTINSVKTGLQNLAQYSQSTNASLSTLKSALTQLQNSLATAFAPILNVVVPALDTLISYLIAAVNAVAQFMAALTGQSSYTVAKRVATDFAAGASAAGSAAGGAADEAERLQRTLMGFDQINKLDDNSSSSSGGSGGGGGAGGAGDLFTTETVENQFAEFAEKIKAAWEAADFTEIGEIFAGKVNAALESIPWDDIQETTRKIAQSIATFLNGFIAELDWNLVGNTFAQGLNTALVFGDTFVSTFDWKEFGDGISEGINSVLTGIEWATAIHASSAIGKGIADSLNAVITEETFGNLGSTVANVVNTVISGAYSFIGTVDWEEWGKAIASGADEYFADLDWEKAGLSFSDAVKGILNTLKTAIEGISWKSVGNSIGTMLKKIEWKEILSSVGDLIWEAIKAAIEVWKSSFDASPIETTIVSAVLLLKFTGLGSSVANTIWQLIKSELTGSVATTYANVGAETLATTLAGSIKTALMSTGVAATIGAGVAFIYKGIKDMLADPNTYINNGVQDYIEQNPGSLAGDGETPEIEINITGNNQAFKETVAETVEYINETLPNETAVEVTAEVTELTNGQKHTLKAVVDASDLTNTQKKILRTTIDAGNLTNSQKRILQAIVNASSLSNTGKKTLNAAIAASGISNPKKKTLSAGLKVRSITNPLKRVVSAMVKITGQTNIPTIETKANFVTGGHAIMADGGLYKNGSWKPITAAANGGSFSTGQMFIAREAGPELVGTIGGSTAVMNNNQIVSSVSAGVYSAVVAAMARAGGNNKQPIFNIYVGGKRITDVVIEEVNNRTKSTGQCPILT